MHPPGLPSFIAASLVLALTPGPGVVYIVGRTLGQGRVAGLASVAGVACGNGLNAIGAALGLAALFAVSDAAFLLVRWAGCAWLVWLGVRLLRSGWRDRRLSADERPRRFVTLPADRPSTRRLCSDGLLVALFNPKTTLFFAAFLPQFIDPMASALPQVLALGAGFVAIAACTDAGYVLLASVFVPRGSRPASTRAIGIGPIVSGAALVALGLTGAATGARRSI